MFTCDDTPTGENAFFHRQLGSKSVGIFRLATKINLPQIHDLKIVVRSYDDDDTLQMSGVI